MAGAGHRRLAAAQAAELTEVPGAVVDGERPAQEQRLARRRRQNDAASGNTINAFRQASGAPRSTSVPPPPGR